MDDRLAVLLQLPKCCYYCYLTCHASGSGRLLTLYLHSSYKRCLNLDIVGVGVGVGLRKNFGGRRHGADDLACVVREVEEVRCQQAARSGSSEIISCY